MDVEALRTKKRENMRRWRAQNREHVRAKGRAQYAANIEKIRERKKKEVAAHRAADREKYNSYMRAYRAANKEKMIGYDRLRDPGKRRVQDLAKTQKRRAIKKATTTNFTAADWQGLVAASPHCHWCKRPWTAKRRPTHDHVIPLSRGGWNSLENSVCACRECNSRKNNGRYHPITGQGILL